ncbi:MAG: lytic transglycosylase domain-containing protein [Proteobacteria bacterium]|nr:lytic transglycosylase domain-containing protein [Pseudomonadota bacterium]
MRRLVPGILFAILILPSEAFGDIYRYQTDDGEVILTTEPRKGLKLLEVIRDSKPAAKPAKVAKAPAPRSGGEAKPKLVSGVKAASNLRETAYDAFIEEASRLYNIPVEFIKAVIKIESNFNPRAVSSVGAMGLMQLMPGTADHMRVSDPFDPRENILGGTKYLRRLSDRYDGDINLILSGYHAGPGNVAKAGGIPFEKTQQYVRNVYNWYVRYREDAKK